MILNDAEIRQRALAGMITPFEEGVKRKRVISYGLTSFGYDARLGNEIGIMREPADLPHGSIDPKEDIRTMFRWFHGEPGDAVMIPAHGFLLGKTVERFNIPRDVSATCLGKSTYARCGLIVNVTPLEPEWRGEVTLEISNTTHFPAYVYIGEGIAQFQFHKGNPCEISYADKGGKYQDQSGVTLPRVD